jgi:hypothetical protein
MAADREQWTARVEAWRSSGRSAKEFCRGQGYSASALGYWSSRLRKEAEAKKEVRLARVIRRPSPTLSPEPSAREHAAGAGSAITVVVGSATVNVSTGFDAATLVAVVDALESRMVRRTR